MAKSLTASAVDRAIADAGKKGMKAYDVSDARVGGLQLRVRPRRATFTIRVRHNDLQRRFELGTAVSGSEDTEAGICLATARDWALKVKYLCRPKAPPTDPNKHLAAWRAGTTLERMEKSLPPPEVKQPPSITWEEAKKSYLAEVERKNAESSLKDYRNKLAVPELDRFNGQPVSQISIELMSTAIADVHARGAESMAEGCARIVSAMWTYLSNPVMRGRTNAKRNEMSGLKAPDRSRKPKDQDADFDPNDEEDGKLPTEIDCGRTLVIARAGVFPPHPSLMIQLLLGTVQRRRAVTEAYSGRFHSYAALNEEAWYVPPWSRKSGADQRSHLVPCVGWCANVVLELDRLLPTEKGYFFPPVKVRSAAKRPQNTPAWVRSANT